MQNKMMKRITDSKMALVAVVLALFGGTVNALTINRNFIGGTAPSAGLTAGGGDIQEIFNVAADFWEKAIGDDHTITINFEWSNLGAGIAESSITSTSSSSGALRPTVATISFRNNTIYWFLDPTPKSAEEWGNFQEYHSNIDLVSLNVGRVFSSYKGPKPSGQEPVDLLTVAIHEIGHALGLAQGFTPGSAEVADNDVDITYPRAYNGISIGTYPSSAHLNLPYAVMNPLFPPDNLRRWPSTADILCVAEVAEFESLNYDPYGAGAIYEAEDAELSGPSIVSGNNSFNGQYVDFTAASQSATFRVSVNNFAETRYLVTIRYSQASGTSTMNLSSLFSLFVPVSTITFTSTGADNQWETVEAEVRVSEGFGGNLANFKLTSIGSSAPNIDYVSIRPLNDAPEFSSQSQYKFYQRSSGNELAVATETQNNANIVAETYSESNDHKWELINAGQFSGSTYYLLRNYASGQYLNVSGGYTLENDNIAQWPTANEAQYRFRMTGQDGNYYLLQFQHSGLVIGTIASSNGTNVQQVAYQANSDRRWSFVPSTPAGYYRVVRQSDGLELALATDTQNNGNIVAESPSSAQDHFWNPVYDSGNYFLLKNTHSNQYLNASGAYTRENTNIAQWPTTGTDANYRVQFIPAGGGYYLMQFKHSGLCIGTISNNAGTNVEQKLPVGTNDRQWGIIEN